MTTARKKASAKVTRLAKDAPIVAAPRLEADSPVVAPPSPQTVVVNAHAQLMPSLVQAQTDLATLTALLAAWPADAPASLQPVVEILLRTLEGVMLMAQATGAMAQATGLT